MQRCFRALPYAGGIIVAFLIAFALYVRSVPPAPPRATMTQQQVDRKMTGNDIPEFMYIDTSKDEGDNDDSETGGNQDQQQEEDIIVDLDSNENQPKEPNDNMPPSNTIEPENVQVPETKPEEPVIEQVIPEEKVVVPETNEMPQETVPVITEQEVVPETNEMQQEPPPQQQEEIREEPMAEL